MQSSAVNDPTEGEVPRSISNQAFLGFSDDPEQLPNFVRLLELAPKEYIGAESAHILEPQDCAYVESKMETLRNALQQAGACPLLIELAIVHESIPDETAQRQVDRLHHPTSRSSAFGSFSIWYGNKETSENLLEAYHQAINEITKSDQQIKGPAIMGRHDTYDCAYLLIPPPTWKTMSAPIPLGGIVKTAIRAQTFPFSLRTTGEVSIPEEIPRKLMELLSASAPTATANCFFLIVPFKRPYLFSNGRTTPSVGSSGTPMEAIDRPGGCVFALCRLQEDKVNQRNTLPSQNIRSCAEAAAWRLHWILSRSLLLEAFRERKQNSEVLLHSLSSALGVADHSIGLACSQMDALMKSDKSKPLSRDAAAEVFESLRNAFDRVSRLRKLAGFSHEVFKISRGLRVGRNMNTHGTVDELYSALEEVAKSQLVVQVSFKKRDRETLESESSDPSLLNFHHLPPEQLPEANPVAWDEDYLEMAVAEAVRNAVRYGAWSADEKAINIRTFLEEGCIWVCVSNPIYSTKVPGLRSMVAKSERFLGLTQFQVMSEAYKLRPPRFKIDERGCRFDVEFALAMVDEPLAGESKL